MALPWSPTSWTKKDVAQVFVLHYYIFITPLYLLLLHRTSSILTGLIFRGTCVLQVVSSLLHQTSFPGYCQSSKNYLLLSLLPRFIGLYSLVSYSNRLLRSNDCATSYRLCRKTRHLYSMPETVLKVSTHAHRQVSVPLTRLQW